jgi:hypothetical protein
MFISERIASIPKVVGEKVSGSGEIVVLGVILCNPSSDEVCFLGETTLVASLALLGEFVESGVRFMAERLSEKENEGGEVGAFWFCSSSLLADSGSEGAIAVDFGEASCILLEASCWVLFLLDGIGVFLSLGVDGSVLVLRGVEFFEASALVLWSLSEEILRILGERAPLLLPISLFKDRLALLFAVGDTGGLMVAELFARIKLAVPMLEDGGTFGLVGVSLVGEGVRETVGAGSGLGVIFLFLGDRGTAKCKFLAVSVKSALPRTEIRGEVGLGEVGFGEVGLGEVKLGEVELGEVELGEV